MGSRRQRLQSYCAFHQVGCLVIDRQQSSVAIYLLFGESESHRSGCHGVLHCGEDAEGIARALWLAE
jgi:hypothetical protein